jgi:hypothetical protein
MHACPTLPASKLCRYLREQAALLRGIAKTFAADDLLSFENRLRALADEFDKLASDVSASVMKSGSQDAMRC